MVNVIRAVEQILSKDKRYKFEVYPFVLTALNFTLHRLKVSRHVTAKELLDGIRDYAREQFGPMARTVFEYWNVFSTEDFGNVVFNLIDAGLLKKTPEDKIEDFKNIYDFNQAFS
jgi:uncharacterized repeat protein (TIGR04138 family)